MADSLSTGTSALLAFQRAIATTSHNIANSATEGYTRQGIELKSLEGSPNQKISIGRGVAGNNTIRFEALFATTRIIQATSESSRLDTLSSYSRELDQLFSDTGLNLSGSIDDLFSSLSNVNNDPENLTNRNALIDAINNLGDRINGQYRAMEQIKNRVSADFKLNIDTVNALTEEIARINTTILSNGGAGSQSASSDLIDQRNLKLQELARIVNIQTVEQDNGSMNVFLSSGQSLIAGPTTTKLQLSPNSSSTTGYEVHTESGHGLVQVNSTLRGGTLGALTEYSSQILASSMNQLGQLSLVLSDALNQQHKLGIDLQGNAGNELLTLPQTTVVADARNTGTAIIEVNIDNYNLITASDYRVDFDGLDYSATRLSDNHSVSGGRSLEIDGVTINIDGTMSKGDSFLVQPTANAARAPFAVNISARELAVGYPIRVDSFNVDPGNTNSAIIEQLDPLNPALANQVTVQFSNDAQHYDLVDTLTGTTLVENAELATDLKISFNGWTMALSQTPQIGDRYAIEPNLSGVGDNSNGLALSARMSDRLIGEQSTITESYGQMVSSIGRYTRQNELNAQAADTLYEEAKSSRDSVSGVNLDEEAIALTRYQQAYQAAAKVIATSDQLFQTLIGVIRG